ncbi:hypothetical protein JCM21714_4506 [Gracilibacillus boraciitolerans JCM 21714]|uniref:Uncharacterized protein n=1 Tax=Gracilibacillus boraciitolerans JCM 21714 TaxID=1298598 RepID=W4VQ24_9BACI|nr:hypothetical protein [Gracilibacillus boraciitolerans]GAE95286.1 hypothetical protein JCM21714_4506 [Gracilibacillus boraciitolerans JCM 21714]
MRYAFSKLFWGFLIVLLELHLFVLDVLPDPVGYYLIYLGVNHLVREFPIGVKAKNLAIGLIVLSIPTVFIQQNSVFSQAFLLSEWSIYVTVLSLLKLILVFYIFQLMIEISNRYGNLILMNKTKNILRKYLIIMLLIHITQPVTMNLSMDEQITYSIISALIGLIMEIVLLGLFRRFMKIWGGDESDHAYK